jgi:CRISPR/Cas system CSM-associated protein Csm2 small subunit
MGLAIDMIHRTESLFKVFTLFAHFLQIVCAFHRYSKHQEQTITVL